VLCSVCTYAVLLYPCLIGTAAAIPRMGWLEHFVHVIKKELTLKLWSHTSTFVVPGS
ncbi:hypothetical protein FOMPIDRAFT_1128695, partial [Fomitopsis schrenkii]